ncbi:MAG: ABC transporter permease subunit [Coriobacteriia bacterium]
MNVFLHELRTYRKSTIIWIVALSGLILMFMSLYPAFTKDVAATREIFNGFPAALRAALNISLANFFTIYGFYGYLLGFAILTGAVQAMNLGTGIISKEVAGKTADFLLSKPITRARVVTAKLTAALAALVITNIVFIAVSYFVALGVAEDSFDTQTFLVMASTLFLVQLMFLALGALVSVIIPKIKSVIAVSLPTVFGFYIIGMIGEALENESFRYITPFKFYDITYMIEHAGLEGRYLAIEAAFVVVATALCYVIYLKKDVRASA